MDAARVLDREFLEIRAKLLELAAALDRLDRGEGHVRDDPRWEKIRQALALLQEDQPGRAERFQLIFSRPYHASWQTDLGISPRQG